MVKKVQSAGGIVYYIDPETKIPHFLLIKRHALSKKIEWVTPKWKIQNGEKPEHAAVREISEEAGLILDKLVVKQVLDTLQLQLYNDAGRLWVDKDITYYLVQYMWSPSDVKILDSEWYIGVYKWAEIENVLGLVHYRDLRELFRTANSMIGKISVRDNFIKNF